MLAHTREDLAKADTKANILFAAIGVVAAALLGAAFAGDWTPAELPLAAELLAWVAVSGIYLSLLSAGAAIFPRMKVVHPRRLTFFGQVARLNDLPELQEELEREADRHDDCRDAEQLLVLSRTAWRKYRFVQLSLLTLWISSAFAVAAGIVAALV